MTRRKALNEVHLIVGMAVLIAYLALTVLNFLRFSRGSRYPWARALSFAGGGLLLLQYVLGFGLLGDDGDITPIHYVLALAIIIPVGAEHMIANSDQPEPAKSRNLFLATLVTTILLVIVYAIGETNA
jgi:hypothetical protein